MDDNIKKWFKMTFGKSHGDDERYYKTWKYRFEQGPRNVWAHADLRSRKYLKKVFKEFKNLDLRENLYNPEHEREFKWDRWSY